MEKTITLDDAIAEFTGVTLLHRGTPVEDARNVLLACMARELIEHRGEDGFDQLARAQKKYAETRRQLRRHKLAVAWALGEGVSDFAEDMEAAGPSMPYVAGSGMRPPFWWRAKLRNIARGK